MRQEPKFVIHLRVVFALIMREMTTRYGRNAGGYVWAVLEPLGMVFMLSLVFSFLARRPPLGESFPVFFATGYMAFYYYLDISRTVSRAVSSNRALLTFPRVTLLDTIIARFILQFLTVTLITAILLTTLILWFAEPVRLDLTAIFTAVALATLLGLAVGMLNSVLFAYSPTWETAFNILNRPLFLISAIFFTYESLPRVAQDVLWWNPLVHVATLMRQGFYANYEPAFASTSYVLFFACVPLMTAILLLRVLRREMLEQ